MTKFSHSVCDGDENDVLYCENCVMMRHWQCRLSCLKTKDEKCYVPPALLRSKASMMLGGATMVDGTALAVWSTRLLVKAWDAGGPLVVQARINGCSVASPDVVIATGSG